MCATLSKLIISGLFLCVAFGGPAIAGDELPQKSLFLAPQEAHEAQLLARQEATRTGNIHLGAVVFYAPDDWTLWLQGEKWTPDTVRGDLGVLEVTEDSVSLTWRDENGVDRNFTLKPNETYEIATGQIISEP